MVCPVIAIACVLWFGGLKVLLGAVTLTIGLQMAVIYWSPFQRVFKTAALNAGELLFTLALCSLVLVAVEIEKWFARRRSRED